MAFSQTNYPNGKLAEMNHVLVEVAKSTNTVAVEIKAVFHFLFLCMPYFT